MQKGQNNSLGWAIQGLEHRSKAVKDISFLYSVPNEVGSVYHCII